MISKELFSEVMNIKIEDIVDLKIFGKGLKYYEKCLLNFCGDGRLSKYKHSICKSINIYELAHKCKEWAFYTYKISVSSFKSGSFYLKEFNQIKDNSEYWVELDTASIDCEINIDDSGIFKSYSEPEAIFKACQWILDNKSGSSE